MSRKELLAGLSEEQIAKVEACKSSAEILALAQEEGIELTDEQLAAVSGGFCDDDKKNDDETNNKDDGHPHNNPF